MARTGRRKYMSTRFWCGNLKERNPLEYLREYGRITEILKDWRVWSVLIWLRTGTNGGLL